MHIHMMLSESHQVKPYSIMYNKCLSRKDFNAINIFKLEAYD